MSQATESNAVGGGMESTPELPWYWVICVVVIALVCLLLLAYWFPPDIRSIDPDSARYTRILGGPDKRLVIKGWINDSKILEDEKLRFWFAIENSSKQDIGISHAAIETKGFDVSQVASGCFGTTLKSGATAFCDATVRPFDIHGKFSIALILESSLIEGARYRDSVSLGPVQVTTSSRERWSRFARRTMSLSKDLTLPLLLAIGGFWLKRLQANRDATLKREKGERDARLKDEQDKRDQELKKQATDRAYRQQILNTVLPRYNSYVEKHYIPLAGAFSQLREHSTVLKNGRTAEGELQFVYKLFSVVRKMRYLRESRGGVYFKNRDAEEVVKEAWWLLATKIEKCLSPEFRDEGLRALKPDSDYKDFLDCYNVGGVFKTEWKPRLLGWWDEGGGTGFWCYQSILEIVSATIRFEANRPFDDYWYDASPSLNLEHNDEFQYPAEPADRVARLKNKVAAYVASVEEYRRSKQPPPSP